MLQRSIVLIRFASIRNFRGFSVMVGYYIKEERIIEKGYFLP